MTTKLHTRPNANSATLVHTEWRGIDIEISYISERFAGMDHVEIRSNESVPLPVTETGYRSLFISPECLEESGGPKAYVLGWLDQEGQSAAWKRVEANSQQLSLFDM